MSKKPSDLKTLYAVRLPKNKVKEVKDLLIFLAFFTTFFGGLYALQVYKCGSIRGCEVVEK